MRFALETDQAELDDVLEQVLRRWHRDREIGDPDARRPLWDQLVEIGVPGLWVAADQGGSATGTVEVVVAQRRLGRHLAGGSVLAGIAAVAGIGDGPGLDSVAARIAAGDLVTGALALDPGAVDVAGPEGSRRLTGTVRPVPDADIADALVVTARTAEGPEAFLVDPAGPGVERRALDTMDLSRPMSAVVLDDAPAVPLGARPADLLTPRVLLAWAAESLGGAERCLEATVDYVGTRHAFGRAIGSFQAVKHLCADLYAEVRLSDALLLASAWATDQGLPDAPARCAAALEQCGRTFEEAAKTTIQLHGGIGFTWEHESHRFLRRAISSRRILGRDTALDRIAPLIGLGSAEGTP
jgi:alkylation response protein AidB-like acyl-CoA dehydrogenase